MIQQDVQPETNKDITLQLKRRVQRLQTLRWRLVAAGLACFVLFELVSAILFGLSWLYLFMHVVVVFAIVAAVVQRLSNKVSRLEKKLETQDQEQTALRETITAISSTLDAQVVYQLLAERLTTMLGGTSCRIVSLDKTRQTGTVVARYHVPTAKRAERDSDPRESYVLSHFPHTLAALHNQQSLIASQANGPKEWLQIMRGRDSQTLLLFPLTARGQAIGFAEVWDSTGPREFEPNEISLGQVLTSQAAIAIENAHLFNRTQRHLSELTLLYDIAVAADFTLELDTILQSVARILQHVLGTNRISVWLLEPGEEMLERRAFVSRVKDSALPEQLELGEGIYGQVAETGRPMLIDNAQGENHPNRSILAVPLLTLGQRVIGVVGVESPKKAAFSDQDLRLLRIMAGHLARSIENVRLFAELKYSQEGLVLRNRALEQANERLKELDRLKSSFVASVSHELRTPLNSIIGFSEVLIDGLAGEVGTTAEEYLSYIHASGSHLRDLINDILDLSRLQAGRMPLDLDQVDVLNLVQEVYITLSPLIEEKGQHFEIDQTDPLPTITADRFRLKQILLNLLSNANKFTPQGGHISVRASRLDPSTLRLDVIDDGIGIPLEEQGMIFEEFRQVGPNRQLGEGTGLGLAISRRLVELHGGRIWVESKTGEESGSTFTMLLPIAGPRSDQTEQADSA